MACDEVKQPFHLGGLGLRSMVVNRVLQGKWLWRFMNEDVSFLWRKIQTEFGTEERGWFTGLMSRPHGNNLLKKICMVKKKVPQLHQLEDWHGG